MGCSAAVVALRVSTEDEEGSQHLALQFSAEADDGHTRRNAR